MLQGEHSAILSSFIKLLFVIKDFVLSIFKLILYLACFDLIPASYVKFDHIEMVHFALQMVSA